jgi:hypothetical protein
MIKVFLIAFVALALFACETQQETRMMTQPLQAQHDVSAGAQAPQATCPVCDDGDNCTQDSCSSETNYTCVAQKIEPCCGDKVCDASEDSSSCAADCPKCDASECETAEFDRTVQKCITKPVAPCCGNSICETGEDSASCRADCPVCSTALQCTRSEYDYQTHACVEKPLVPCCGNDRCDKGESCKSCDEDCECESGTDLSSYPRFLKDGTRIIVGDEATSRDSLTAAAMTTVLATEGVDTEANVLSGFSDSELSSGDLIVLGGPCENELWERFQSVECSTGFIATDHALIKLVIKGGREIVYIAGNSAVDTQKAAEALNNHDDYDFEGMEAELDTSGSKARII